VSPVKLPHLHQKHGAYYHVRRVGEKVVWTRLDKDLDRALAKYAAIEAAGRRDEDRSVGAAIAKYLTRRADRIRPSTLAMYRDAQGRLERAFVEFKCDQVRAEHVAQYADSMADRPALANRDLTLLSAAMNVVINLGWATVNPCRGQKFKSPPRRRVLSDGELSALLGLSPLWRARAEFVG
jgi:hypothetical protein